MKKQDLVLIVCVLALFLPFCFSETLFQVFKTSTNSPPFLMSFLKFGILATLGEIIGLRIRTGSYFQQGFGVIPRAITWGFLGILIQVGFIIFGDGAPQVLVRLGISPDGGITYGEMIKHSLLESVSWYHVLAAFFISATMNTLFAPVFMTLHKISDDHIMQTGGSLKGYFSAWHFGELFATLNWGVMWNFVFKKTIPFFWIPAHTITFLLPPDFRVLFAACLGIVLGVFMSIASTKSAK